MRLAEAVSNGNPTQKRQKVDKVNLRGQPRNSYGMFCRLGQPVSPKNPDPDYQEGEEISEERTI